MTDTPLTDTPLYGATLSDLLQRARDEAELVRARCALAERAAGERIAEAECRAEVAERAAQAGRALLAEQVEERVRAALALDAPPLPVLADDVEEPGHFLDGFELPERVAPPVPSMAELLQSSPGVGRFLDAMLGAPER